MDAMVQLALAAMASQTFATEADKFLCFPALNPQSYEPDELEFASGTFRNRDDWTAFSTFSRTVNRIPRGPVYDADSDLLWDVYKEVLDQA
ncbi:MAG: hypothetical protein QOD94_1982, partial [Alphaproteobacteria bacterium]|nr:hypothetical protein [Alphaproteobacteria bacterium]